MDQTTNLTICQDCKQNPAVYGDGLTWSRCSACQLKATQSENGVQEQATQQEPVGQEKFEHEIVPGLVSIIIPVYMKEYSLFHYTGNCIGALREHTPKDAYELVIVDNGSPIQPPELNSYYAQRVIKNEENFGYTKAVNQGIRMSTGEYIVLLTNDVQVFNHWLEDMKKSIDEGGYDLVMAHPMYSQTEPFARAVESRDIRNKVIQSGKFFSDFRDFSCVMFKRSLIDEIGLLDERFVNYCSDVDFIDRIEAAGKKWACCDAVPTSHISSATGYTMAETPRMMDEDKARYAEKKAKGDVEKPKSKYSTFRIEDGGDPIYLLEHKEQVGKYHHISDPETLNALGFKFGDERIMKSDELSTYKFGEDITMKNYKDYV
jgi:glycosyltransferase involved in cell wall biosynthesis